MKTRSPRQVRIQTSVAEFPNRRALNNARMGLYQAVVQSASANTTAACVMNTLLYKFYNVATGACFPGFGKIATEVNKSVPTVRRAIKSLEAAGFICVVRAQGRGNKNDFHFNWANASCQNTKLKPNKGETFSKQDNPPEMAPKPAKNGEPYKREPNQSTNEKVQYSTGVIKCDILFFGLEKWNAWLKRHDYPPFDILAEKVTTKTGQFFLAPDRYPPSSYGTFEEQRVHNWVSQRLAEIKDKSKEG